MKKNGDSMPSILKTPDTEKTIVKWTADKSFAEIVDEVSSKIKGWYLDDANRPVVIDEYTGQLRRLDLVGMKYLASKQIIFIDAHGSHEKHPIILDTIPPAVLRTAAHHQPHFNWGL